jgi:small-conductance mechanosensitive channel
VLVLAAWGETPASFRAALDTPWFGSDSLTWLGLFEAAVTVALVFAVGAVLRNLLTYFAFPRMEIDAGARYAVLTVLRYFVWVFAVLTGLGAAGVDASSLAVFAGAAGVGLAFGLQDIFANFFSGLIMLVERPVRVGDTVEIGGTQGVVEAIRLRGTVLRTLDRASVIIPNRQFIGERLTNLTHRMEAYRLQVQVGVSYDADPAQVLRALEEVARRDGRILKDPAPVARFQGFGPSSLDFSLYAFTGQVENRWHIASDLHASVLAAFRREGIEIPFPQHDVRITYDVRAGTRPPSPPA